MNTIKIPRCKLLRVRFVLSNGIDPIEHYFKIEPHQPDFNQIEKGQFGLLASNFKNNLATFGRVTSVICNDKQIQDIVRNTQKIPQFMKIINLTEEEW